MLRRALLAAFTAGAIKILTASAAPSKENQFAEAYNEWIRLRLAAPEGTVSAPAIRQWKHVKQTWRHLEHSVNQERSVGNLASRTRRA